MVLAFTDRFKKITKYFNLLRTLRMVWAVSKARTLLSALFIFLESSLFFCSLYFLKLIVDKVVAQSSAPTGASDYTVLVYVFAAAIVTVLYISVQALSGYLTEIQAAKVAEYVDDKIHESSIKLDLSFYESPDYFDLLKRAREAGSDKPNLVVTILIQIAKNVMSLIAIGLVLVSINGWLLPLLGLFVLPTLFMRIKFADKMNLLRIKNTHLDRKAGYYSFLISSDTTAKEVRMFGLGNYLRLIYRDIRKKLLEDNLQISRKRTNKEILSNGLSSLGFFACIGYISFGTISGSTSVGDVTLFLVAFPQSFNIMQNLSLGISAIYRNNIFMNNIFELIDLESKMSIEQNPLPIPEQEKVNLEIENLYFEYPHTDKPTLKDINIIIPAGKIIAVVGLNGSGKSTLIKLLSRLYDPTAGKITMGGIDIRNFDVMEYRKQISAVFQDFNRFNVTAKENIEFGDIDGNYTDEDIIRAAKKAGAHDYISKFRYGYETMMGRLFEDGQEVSIGQWQKLAIARSFFSPARFFILDEATSALDTYSESILFNNLRNSIGNRSAIIISHRLSAVKHADYIYVLADGKVAQAGTHDELIMTEGAYSNLFLSELAEI